jgi:hypothetical protein
VVVDPVSWGGCAQGGVWCRMKWVGWGMGWYSQVMTVVSSPSLFPGLVPSGVGAGKVGDGVWWVTPRVGFGGGVAWVRHALGWGSQEGGMTTTNHHCFHGSYPGVTGVGKAGVGQWVRVSTWLHDSDDDNNVVVSMANESSEMWGGPAYSWG